MDKRIDSVPANGESSSIDPGSNATSPLVGVPTRNVGRSVLKNSAAQVVGRMAVALLALFIAGIIVRRAGADIFGSYCLVFMLLQIADWLVDFGTSDVFIRDICRQPQDSPHLLRVLTATKLVQIPAALVIFAAILVALRYSGPVLVAGLVGSVNVVFFAGVLVYRVIFRSTLTMEREVAAELVSVLAMVPMVVFVCARGGGLVALVACYTISRGIFLALCLLLGRSRYRPSIRGVGWVDVRQALRSSVTIGVVGFLVVGYQALDHIVISKLAAASDLAFFSGAQKLTWPLLMVLTSIGGTFYPVIASHWPHARDKFNDMCQRALDSVLLLAGMAVCCVLAGARFFMNLLGPELVDAAPALQVLAVLCVVKAVSGVLGPVLYVAHAQRRALQLVAFATVVKVAVIAALAPRYGYMGVVYGALGVEVCFVLVPSLYLIRRITGYRVRWAVPAKVALITTAAAVVSRLLMSPGGFSAAVLAPVLYMPLAFAIHAVRLSEIRSLLRKEKA